MTGTRKIPVEIPEDLYNQLKEYISTGKGGFSSVEEFVEFVLREVLREEEAEAYSKEEEEEIKKRLENLGYF